MIEALPSAIPNAAPSANLMEAPAPDLARSRRGPLRRAGWFPRARFGMFVHYGLYSIPGRGEWLMHQERIPAREYNRLAAEFRAEKFDAAGLAALAKRAGAGYVVLTARHHDGFCLWDTRTTELSTVRTAAGRDLIREYVRACRAAGLRIGIYYSVMSWQWPAIFAGPARDQEGWERMVEETHAQVRELMTGYGRIDLLWYDGCVVPGLGDAELRARYWRARELDAAVRRLQPDILVNDRGALPGDVVTPEQHLAPPAGERLWEFCQTMGESWGWRRGGEEALKSPRELIRTLVHCARFGGNYLLNVSPHPEGWVPPEQARRMEAIGSWMEINGESVRGSRRIPYTEAEHVAGPATCRGSTLYFHLAAQPEGPLRMAGLRGLVESVRLLGAPGELACEQKEDGTVTVEAVPAPAAVEEGAVLAVRLAGRLPRKAPPSLLVERDTGRHEPAEEPVRAIDGWEMGRAQRLVFRAPSTGRWDLELGVIAEGPTSLAYWLDRRPARPLQVECGNYPVTLRVRNLRLEEGEHEIQLRSRNVAWGLYVWRLQPVWKVLGAGCWRTAGPFPTAYSPQGTTEPVREAMRTPFPPEDGRSAGSAPPEWRPPAGRGESVNLARLCGGRETGVGYARTVVISPAARNLDVLLACDWWANLLVNGEWVKSRRNPEEVAKDGAWFNGWKPMRARLRLRRGENTFLVKCHPGGIDNWFKFFVNDAGDLTFKP